MARSISTSLTALAAITFGLYTSQSHGAFDIAFGDDADLTSFVTRPDIRAPRMNVVIHDSERSHSGYYFVAPYANIYQQKPAKGYFEPCQTGPHIYDHKGDLTWSGACLFNNENMTDFRPTTLANGTSVLSAIQVGLNADEKGYYGDGRTRGQGVLLDSTYTVQTQIAGPATMYSFNMHELRLIDGGKAALHLLWKPEYVDVSILGLGERKAGWIGNMGFRAGESRFEWWAHQHVALTESSWEVESLEGPAPEAWDWFHATSVDKTAEGDYVLSARHTDTIYKICGRTGAISWRLGGRQSDFTFLEQKTEKLFTRQHDARSLSAAALSRDPEIGVDYISLFDNSCDEKAANCSAAGSSSLILRLEIERHKAEVLHRFRSPSSDPDTNAVVISGNTHLLSFASSSSSSLDPTIFTSWGDTNRMTEHSISNRKNIRNQKKTNHLIATASFASTRFETYRAYKLPWKGTPALSEIKLSCTAWGTKRSKATTVCHVSWNGATEVVGWRVWRRCDSIDEGDGDDVDEEVVWKASIPKEGFETEIQMHGFHPFVAVKGVDAEGAVLGKTDGLGGCHHARAVVDQPTAIGGTRRMETKQESVWYHVERSPRDEGLQIFMRAKCIFGIGEAKMGTTCMSDLCDLRLKTRDPSLPHAHYVTLLMGDASRYTSYRMNVRSVRWKSKPFTTKWKKNNEDHDTKCRVRKARRY